MIKNIRGQKSRLVRLRSKQIKKFCEYYAISPADLHRRMLELDEGCPCIDIVRDIITGKRVLIGLADAKVLALALGINFHDIIY